MTEQQPKPGDFAVVHMNGEVGQLIRVAQWLCGKGFADYEHAFILIDDSQLIEAQPGGARKVPLSEYDGRQIEWSSGRIPLTDDQRAKVVAAAVGYLGTPYSFLDYAAIAAHRLYLPIPWLRRYVASTKHMLCSALVDQCFQDAGVQLFRDGRWSGYVTPADLHWLIVRGGEQP